MTEQQSASEHRGQATETGSVEECYSVLFYLHDICYCFIFRNPAIRFRKGATIWEYHLPLLSGSVVSIWGGM